MRGQSGTIADVATNRLLVRVPASAAHSFRASGFGAAGSRLELEPLFTVTDPESAGEMGAAAREPREWFLAQSATPPDVENDWDWAHASLQQAAAFGFSASPDSDIIIEPDLEQRWPFAPPQPGSSAMAATAAAPACQFEDQSADYPRGTGFAWHLQDAFSGLKSAREAAGFGQGIVIAHFDTGYDPKHTTLPKNLDLGRQKNFVEAGQSAADPGVSGTLKNPGHGTGTLSILAGNRVSQPGFDDWLGGAPEATVVPLRVANSVVQFATSSVAKAFVYAREIGADVVSMSMGGTASEAWTDAVNAAYEAGIVIVCASGNNFGGFPSRFIVYPARYRRVLAACGVMQDGQPYFNVPHMQGNYGPSNKMPTALSAFTPNVPWARYGCASLVDMDGQGTSAATPQVAAAAALWLAKHKPNYPKPWMRVEAVRQALFASAAKHDDSVDEALGQGLLRAAEALSHAPAVEASLQQTKRDNASFSFLRVLTGLGVAADPRSRMYALELTQIAGRMRATEDIFPDPDADPERITSKQRRQFFEAALEQGGASRALRGFLTGQLGRRSPAAESPQPTVDRLPVSSKPASRRLRIFALDPSFSRNLNTFALNSTTVAVPWESNATSNNLLQPGPVGEYVEVVDVDPATNVCYAPVDLNDPFVLAQDGLAPSENSPQFHQQMAYAVSMLTIRNFERALGRPALWSPRHTLWPVPRKQRGEDVYIDEYVPRLRIYPHALRQANAFYSPNKKALLFGYFPSVEDQAGDLVFTCLSHDIIAHETTHALLDGVHRRFQEATNPDVLAFHEGFADIVALFQHFTFPDVVRYAIGSSRGDLRTGKILGELAQQFGQGLGRSRALRSAITEDPEKANYNTVTEPHDRGGILVAAVFDAFLSIYQHRIADLLRIATNGTGVLPAGDLNPDLVNRLANEASTVAGRVLNMCIRALDYCPPVDMTFGAYLRALITADYDMIPADPAGYRVAFVEAFWRRYIYPDNARTREPGALLWQAPAMQPQQFREALAALINDDQGVQGRRAFFERSRNNAAILHKYFTKPGAVSDALAAQMGVEFGEGRKVEVHSVRPALRTGPDGHVISDLVIVLTQKRKELFDPEQPDLGTFWFRGGCTMLVDMQDKRLPYIVSRNMRSESGLAMQREWENAGASQ